MNATILHFALDNSVTMMDLATVIQQTAIWEHEIDKEALKIIKYRIRVLTLDLLLKWEAKMDAKLLLYYYDQLMIAEAIEASYA